MDVKSLIDPGFELHWQMVTSERLALLWILEKIQPKLSSVKPEPTRAVSLQVIAGHIGAGHLP